MKRSITLALVLFAVAFTQVTFSQINEPQTGPSCGTDLAMAKMSAERRSEMTASATDAQVSELLLYINFNPNGTVVRPGFGNADNLTTTLVNGTRSCPPPQLDQATRDEIVRLVSDDFSPFNIRVTTDAAEFAAHTDATKQMALITTLPSVIGQQSGVAGVSPFVGIGQRLPGDFAFVFSSTLGNDARDVAAVISHESAHLLGLGHQHLFDDTCAFVNEYHPGFGSGPLSFNPLMGGAISEGVSNWFAQKCVSPTFGVAQNDYDLINSQVAVRADDFPDEPEGEVVAAREITGTLERAHDVDHIKIDLDKAGSVTIISDNIDLRVALLKKSGDVIERFDDPESTNVVIPSTKGVKFLKIRAKRNDNMRAKFMTGTYRVSY
jgi:hypothetical protein